MVSFKTLSVLSMLAATAFGQNIFINEIVVESGATDGTFKSASIEVVGQPAASNEDMLATMTYYNGDTQTAVDSFTVTTSSIAAWNGNWVGVHADYNEKDAFPAGNTIAGVVLSIFQNTEFSYVICWGATSGTIGGGKVCNQWVSDKSLLPTTADTKAVFALKDKVGTPAGGGSGPDDFEWGSVVTDTIGSPNAEQTLSTFSTTTTSTSTTNTTTSSASGKYSAAATIGAGVVTLAMM